MEQVTRSREFHN